MNKIKSVKKTRADLIRRIYELEAQSATNIKTALSNISKADEQLMASAVILKLTVLGGREICPQFAIRDGLSNETISAIKNDIIRTMKLSGYI